MDMMFEKCAGIDVHAQSVVVTVRAVNGRRVTQETRTFETFADSLRAMVAWLASEQVEAIGLESTGVYWKPVVRMIRAMFERAVIWLVNPAAIKQVPGRKTDVKDAEWLAKLVMFGLVRPSFLPSEELDELRVLTRHRRSLVRDRASITNRVVKTIESSGIKLASVCSDVLGKSGRAMLEAFLTGTSTPKEMAQLAQGILRRKIPDLERALEGTIPAGLAFVLLQLLQRLDAADADIASVDVQISKRLTPHEQEVALLKAIPGVDTVVAAVILAELGGDMSVFPSADHAVSWAGLSPGSCQSAGKAKNVATRKGNEPLRTALVQAAWTATRKKQSFARQKYHQLVGRLGKKKAIVAIARKMLVSIFYVLRDREGYIEPTQPRSAGSTQRRVRACVEQLAGLGYDVVLTERPVAPAA